MSTVRQLYRIVIPLGFAVVVTSGILIVLNSVSWADGPEQRPSNLTRTSSDRQTNAQLASESADRATKPALSERRRQHVRQLIQSLLPQKEIAGLDIWVDEFADLPDDEIRFMVTQSSILQQDSLLPALPGQLDGTGFGSQPMIHFDSPNRIPMGRSADIHHDNTGEGDAAARVALQNLRSTMTVGYREQLRLNIASAGKRAGLTPMTVHSMAVGEVVTTGNPLHLAIRTAGAVFFLLDNGQLTRNGSFQRNVAGQLGLTSEDEFIPLSDSPLVPDAADWRVDRGGQVVLKSDSTVLGSITTVQVTDPTLLTTEDGVYFRIDSATTVLADAELLRGQLELSNVDVARNRNLIEARR